MLSSFYNSLPQSAGGAFALSESELKMIKSMKKKEDIPYK